jgi:hypothetical protein
MPTTDPKFGGSSFPQFCGKPVKPLVEARAGDIREVRAKGFAAGGGDLNAAAAFSGRLGG